MKKRFIGLLLTFCFALSFCPACDNGQENSQQSTEQQGNAIIGANGALINVEDSIELRVGETYTLDYSVYPFDSVVEWSVLNADIVTVENGVVTAKSVGNTSVIASISDDDKAVCKVNVKEAEATLYQLQLSREELRLFVGESFTLDATLRRGATVCSNDGIIWTSSDSLVASVSAKGEITPKTNGQTTITATYRVSDTQTVKAKCTVTVLDNYELVIAEADNGISVYRGETFTITPNVYTHAGTSLAVNAVDFSYSSANENIVKYQNGVFKAVGTGEVEVFVSYKGHKSSCRVRVWGLSQKDFAMVQGEEGTKIESVLNYGFTYTGVSNGVSENYFAIDVDAWRTFIETAESRGYIYISITIHEINGIVARRPQESVCSLLGGNVGDVLRSEDVSPNKPFVNKVLIADCKSWANVLIGMYGSGSFSFTINME